MWRTLVLDNQPKDIGKFLKSKGYDFFYRTSPYLGLVPISSELKNEDVKTQNIFIAKNGILKLGDFGISRSLEYGEAKAQTSVGTPLFMPPEVCQGKEYDNKADVWALGVILYELITLKKPFESPTVNGLLQAIIKVQFEPLPPETNSDLKMLVAALLDKDHIKRPTIF